MSTGSDFCRARKPETIQILFAFRLNDSLIDRLMLSFLNTDWLQLMHQEKFGKLSPARELGGPYCPVTLSSEKWLYPGHKEFQCQVPSPRAAAGCARPA